MNRVNKELPSPYKAYTWQQKINLLLSMKDKSERRAIIEELRK